MFYRRKEGEKVHWGFTYDWDERSFIEIVLAIPTPIFIFGKYNDYERRIKYKCWRYYLLFLSFRLKKHRYFQYYSVFPQYRFRRLKIRPTIVFDIKTWLKPVVERGIIKKGN